MALRLSLKAPEHAIHHVLPTVKDHRAREGPDILAKGLAPGKHATQQRLRVITPCQHGMEQQGQQVERQVYPAAPEACPEAMTTPPSMG